MLTLLEPGATTAPLATAAPLATTPAEVERPVAGAVAGAARLLGDVDRAAAVLKFKTSLVVEQLRVELGDGDRLGLDGDRSHHWIVLRIKAVADVCRQFLIIHLLAGGRQFICIATHLGKIICHRHVTFLRSCESKPHVHGLRTGLGGEHLLQLAPCLRRRGACHDLGKRLLPDRGEEETEDQLVVCIPVLIRRVRLLGDGAS